MTRQHALERLRNIGIIAHIDAGKTTATERILLAGGRIRRAGEVHDGNATMDFDPQERARGITINAAATSVHWRDHQITIIDTPGHVDFTAEVERALRVLDGGVALFDAVAGVEPQSETVWRQADRYGVPRLAFVNKMDRVGADFARVVQMIRAQLGVRALPIQLPIGAEEAFVGVIDLVGRRAIRFAEDGLPAEGAIPPELASDAASAWHALVEALAEEDDALLEAYLSGAPIAAEALRGALRRATLAGRVVPVLCGAALRNKGLQALLDAVVDYLPSPADIGGVRGEAPSTPHVPAQDSDQRPATSDQGSGAMKAQPAAARLADDDEAGLYRPADPDAPLTALVFKVVDDDHAGQLSYVRIYAGRMTGGSYVLNSTRNLRERVARMLRMHADQATPVAEAGPGEIVALVGPKQSRTGDTLCDPDHPIRLEAIQFPTPVVRVAVEPRSAADRERLGPALRALCATDPTLEVSTDEESGQLIVAGMGELHLDVQLTRLKLDYGVEVRRGRPQVAYRETAGGPAEVEQTLARQSGGGSGQWARVRLRVEPLARGAGFSFVDAVVGGAVPRQFIPAVEAGVRDGLGRGPLAGYPVVDVQVTLLGGAFHPVDSSELAFRTVAAQAIREALAAARPLLLEPVMHLEVTVPDAGVGAVLGDLGGRRGRVLGLESRAGAQLVRARAPLAELFGYTDLLRSLTQGRGSASIDRPEYEPLPPQLEALVRKAAGR